MEFLQQVYDGLLAFSSWYWGIPIILILVCGGIFLTFSIRGIQFTRLGYILKKTFGTMFSKGERDMKKKGVTPLQSMLRPWAPRWAPETSWAWLPPSPSAAPAPCSGCGYAASWPWPSNTVKYFSR